MLGYKLLEYLEHLGQAFSILIGRNGEVDCPGKMTLQLHPRSIHQEGI